MKLTPLSSTILTIAATAIPFLASPAMAEQSVSVTSKTEVKAATKPGMQAETQAETQTEIQTGTQTRQVNPTALKSSKPAARVIPADSVIMIGFPRELSLDASKPTTHMLQLAQPIYDDHGEELIPVNAYINVKLKPTQEGIEVVADAVTVKGRKVALTTNSVIIPGQTLTIKSGMEQAKENRTAASGLFGSLLGGLGASGAVMEQGMMLGNAGGWLTGLGAGQTMVVVKIPQGTVHMLATTTAVTLPGSGK
jgi:hypothetical protein